MNRHITLTGPSGTGKSTLARHIHLSENTPYFEGSAGLTISDSDKLFLKANYGWKGDGHKGVISLGVRKPFFGRDFQIALLRARFAKFDNTDGEFITDRAIADNIAYFWAQVLPFVPQKDAENFLGEALEILNLTTTHLIFIETTNPKDQGIEDNNSRIANWYYQKHTSSTFKHVLEEYIIPNFKGKYLHIDFWDLEQRKQIVTDFLR